MLVIDCVPDVAFVPLHPPDAEHEVALVADHDNVMEPPLVTDVLSVLSDTVGGGVDEIVTVTVLVTEPPAPVQAIAKLREVESGPVDSFPETALEPDQPLEAVQAVAPVDDQVSTDDPPLGTLAGFALNETVGTSLPPTVALSPLAPPPLAPPPPQADNSSGTISAKAHGSKPRPC